MLGRLDECAIHYSLLQENLIALGLEIDNYPRGPKFDMSTFPDEITRKDILDELRPPGMSYYSQKLFTMRGSSIFLLIFFLLISSLSFLPSYHCTQILIRNQANPQCRLCRHPAISVSSHILTRTRSIFERILLIDAERY